MKKQMLKSALIALAGVGLMSGVALADPVNQIITTLPGGAGAEQDIADVITGLGLDPINDQTGNALWTPADVQFSSNGYTTSAAWEIEYIGGIGSFGIYDANGGETYTFTTVSSPLSTPVDGVIFGFFQGNLYVNFTKVTNTGTWSSVFGLFFSDTSGITYTEDSKNGTSKALTFSVPSGVLNSDGNNDWVIAFDRSAGPVDYNDAVIGLRDASPVPEPAAMLLFGTGIIGLAGVARRKN